MLSQRLSSQLCLRSMKLSTVNVHALKLWMRFHLIQDIFRVQSYSKTKTLLFLLFQSATQGDGAFFQANLGLKDR